MCPAGTHARSLPLQKQSRATVQRDGRLFSATADNEMVIEVEPGARDYMATMMALPAFQEWTRAGLAETIIIDRFETV